MRATRVLLLTEWYPPEPVGRAGRLAEGLQSRGFEVRVVTAFPSYPHGKIYSSYKQRPRSSDAGPPAVTRVWSWPSRSLSLPARGLSYLSFALSALCLGLWGRRPDVIWAYQPPPSIALPALVARRVFRAPVVYEIQDMWPDTLTASGLHPEGRLSELIERAMQVVYRRAERIVVISDGFRRLLEERGVDADKVVVHPNWPDTTTAARVSETRPGDRVRLLYAGNVGPAQRLPFFVRALAAANAAAGDARPQLELTILGDGPMLDQTRAEASQHGVRLQVLPRVPASEVADVASRADALVVNLAADPAYEATIPSKVVAYLALGKPIIGGLEGDGAAIVEGAEAGITFPPEDLEAAVEALHALADSSEATRRAWGRNGRRTYESSFTAEGIIDAYAGLIAELAGPRRREGRFIPSRWDAP